MTTAVTAVAGEMAVTTAAGETASETAEPAPESSNYITIS